MKIHHATVAILVAAVLAWCWNGSRGWAGQTDPPGQIPPAPTDPWNADDLLKSEDLARLLSVTNGEKPLLLYVGYSLPY